jgi:putative phosphoesterase
VSRLRSVAALYDIHGNLPALDAVLDELRSDPPDAVVVGGDVAAGPMPLQVLTRLRELPWPVHWLRGNADRAVVMGFDGTIPAELRNHPLFRGDAWAATFLSRADRDFLDALSPLLTLEVEGLAEALFCHGTAHSDEERVTTATPVERLARVLAQAGADVLVGGHTHRQFDRTAGGRRMINAGSVGRPYEHDPGAYWLRLGPAVRLMRTA